MPEQEAPREKQLRMRLEQLMDISQALMAEQDVNRLLIHVMEAAMALTSSDAGSLYLIEDARTAEPAVLTADTSASCVFSFEYARNHSIPFDFEAKKTPIRSDSINGYVALSGKPIRIRNARILPEDAPYKHDSSFDERTGYQTGSMLTVPMRNRGSGIIGVLQLINRMRPDPGTPITETCAPYSYTEEDEQMMVTFSSLAATALENSRLHSRQAHLLQAQEALTASLTEANLQLEALSRRILTAHEEERRRIARDLHDGPAQTIANLVLKTEIIEKLMERKDEGAARLQIVRLQADIRTATSDIRGIMSDLKPAWLDQGLFTAIENRVDLFRESMEETVELSLTGQDVKLPPYMASAVFQMVQEALTNIGKYAGASHVWIQVNISEDTLEASVRDDGTGFDMKDVDKIRKTRKPGSGFGLEGMRERVDLLQGTLIIASEPGKGTEIHIQVPVSTTLLRHEQPLQKTNGTAYPSASHGQ